MIVVDNTAGAAGLVVRQGATTVSVPAGASQLLHTTGTTGGLVAVAPAAQAGAKAAPVDIALYFPGLPEAAEQLLKLEVARGFTLPADLPGSRGHADTAATASAALAILKNGVAVGSITLAAASQDAAFALAGGLALTLIGTRSCPMALLFIDGCGLYYAAREQIARRWEPNATSVSHLSVTAGRWDGCAIQLASAGTGRIIRPTPPRQTVILAFAARFTRSDRLVNQAFITLYDPTWTQVVIAIDFLEGRYRCYRGWFDTEIAQSAVDVAAVAKEQYHWFELKVTITSATFASASLGIRDGRVLSRNSPSTPASM